ncbi:MAG: c-type cytochrome biogenesis protein CcmI [Pseudomonadales bacterium]|nr:c-type cytochrome biogenesis protein CcmI [Pseudomonadales bacterium]
MTSLWFFIALLLVLALVFVVVPVLRFRGQSKPEQHNIRKEKNIEVFNQSLLELQGDLAQQLIDQEQFEKLKVELQRGFLSDMEESAKVNKRTQAAAVNRWLPLLLALLVPVLSIGLYLNIGSNRDLVLPALMAQISSAEDAEQQQQALDDLADVLQARFEHKPGDVQGAYMLGTLYIELQRYDEAAGVFTKLLDHVEAAADKATILGQLAQAQYLAADQEMTEAVRSTVARALVLNPNESATLSLLAIDAFIKQNFDEALGYWRRQLAQTEAGSAEAGVLRDRIARVAALLPQGQGESTEANTGGLEAISLNVRVDVDPAIKDQVSQDMRVFVYARSTAMPQPLAAATYTVADLPLELSLDDSMAMLPGLNLSSADTVLVGARISRSGQAIAQSGDYQAITEPFAVREQSDTITLTIKDLVP